MNFTNESFDDIVVVTPRIKEITSDNSLEFRDKLSGILKENTEVILDLCEIGFIDSSGLGALINCYKNLDRRKDIILCGMNQQVVSLFAITHLDKIFNIYTNREEAIKSR
ncbi:MAG: anti-sigma factor antagonist [Melioribacteraceae bacterium]|nr:MAG: anti-sigma factor antagonist [Melioribacteraceae bacterium]